MRGKVVVLNFDDSLVPQLEFLGLPCEVLDLRDLREVRLFCSPASKAELARRIGRCRGRPVLVGSSDYHYVTYLLLSQIAKPFTLLLFDNHADLNPPPAPSFLSCDSWLASALRLSHLRRALVVGADPRSFSRASGRHLSKLVYVPYGELEPGAERPRVRTAASLEERKGTGFLLGYIPTRAVYLSVDKDVLRPGEDWTNWDQGKMCLSFLVRLLREVASVHEVVGLDVSGEASLSPWEAIGPHAKEVLLRNAQANRALLLAPGEMVARSAS